MKYRHKVLTFLSFLAVITYLDRICISVAGPRIQDELHLTPQDWGLISGAFTLAYAAFEIPSGHLGDRYGARLMLTRIVLWWSAFTALTGWVSGFSSLLLVRFCFGAGEAGAFPGASSSLFNWFPALERGRAFGVIWMSSQIGGALAPLLVVPIQAAFGWRISFFIFGFVGVVWAVAWWLWYRNRPQDVPAVTAEELAEIGASPTTIDHTFPWRPLLRNKSVWAVMGVAWAYVYAYNFFLFWLPTYLVRARGFEERELSLTALPFILAGLANFSGGIARDAAVKKWGVKWGQRVIGVLSLAASAICVLAALGSVNRYAALVWLAFCYAAIAFQQTTVWAVCVDIGRRYAGAVAGSMNTAANLGGLTSSLLFGVMVQRLGGYEIPMMTMAAVLFLGSLLWLRIDGTEELGAHQAASLRRPHIAAST